MNDLALTSAQELLLAPNSLDGSRLGRTLDTMLSSQLDYADLYFQRKVVENWNLEDGLVKSGAFRIRQGVGVRGISGDRSALAYSDDMSLKSIVQAADATRAVSAETRNGRIDLRRDAPIATGKVVGLYPSVNPIETLGAADKVALLSRIDHMARARDPRVVSVNATLAGEQDTVLVMRSDDHVAADIRPLVRLSINVMVEQNGRRESASVSGGARAGYDLFTDAAIKAYVDHAVDTALVQLEAIAAPAGTMTVVCGSGWPGVLLHEAVGHGLEGDFIRKGSSAFAGLIGQRVAAPGVTIVDDGTLSGRRGSLAIDDEGCHTQCTTLIEDGILVGFIQDSLNARLMGAAPTGNGRRESFSHSPLPRMTNTYMLNGSRDPQEIIASVKHGIYALEFSGGQVDIISGRFTFGATHAYLIENGRITAPVKGATLVGNGPESLKHISMIGNDFALDDGFASCGKAGQTVPVGVGQPTLRIDNMTVGGTH